LFLCLLIFLFLVSLNFLSASCTFCLTMSSNISMKFSVITCRISSLRKFLWASLDSLVSFIFVLLVSGIGYPFLYFSLNPVLNYFWGKNSFYPFFTFPSLHLLLCNYVLDRLLVVSVTCFLSLGLILFCWCIGFLA
jgi:hypothetical protein